MASHSETLAAWVAQLDPRAIPAEVQSTARLLIADSLGTALLGARTTAGRVAAEFAAAQEGPPEATLLGRDRRISALHAAFANTVMGRADTFDDSAEEAGLHAGVTVIMTSLAMGERQDGRGDRLMAAIVAGYELAVRAGAAIMPWHRQAGFHPTGTATCFGTAASASVMLGLDADRTLAALGLAAEQAAGLREYQFDGGIDISAFHAAKAAHSGIVAALLAQAGFPGPRDPLEGPLGFLRVMAPRYEPRTLHEGLGERYRILGASLKPYPSCRSTHGATGVVLHLARSNPSLQPEALRSLLIRTYHDALDHCDRPRFDNLLDAQFSIQYHAAVALQRGTVTLDDFEPERLADPRTLDLASRIRVEHAPELEADYPAQRPCEAIAELSDGRVLRARLDAPPGSPENPLSEDEVWGKFEGLAARALPSATVQELRRWIESFDDTTSVRSLGRLLSGARGV